MDVLSFPLQAQYSALIFQSQAIFTDLHYSMPDLHK